MKFEITNKKVNPLFNRTEISFEIKHDAETPSRGTVIAEIAKALKVDEGLIVLDYIRQPFGRKSCYGRAKIYRTKEDMKVEAKHLLERATKALEKMKGGNVQAKEGGA